MSRSSTARIEQRVRKKIEDGEFYEAHQMYRTIFSRQKYVKLHYQQIILGNDRLLDLKHIQLWI